MKKNKLKFLILILALFIANKPLNIIAEGNNETQQPNQTVLDGMIGEWDPTLADNPNFNGVEIEGNRPESGDYYTISVTVPLNMEFYVFPTSTSTLGSFYSPVYNIKNNGSKTISAKIKSFDMVNEETTEDSAPLYVEKVIRGDKRTQIELKLCAIEDLKWDTVSKEVDLTKINSEDDGLTEDEKTLYSLSANEVKRVKFDSDRWDLPKFETEKENAISNFTAGFEFSIDQPQGQD